jgi:hypothetical protein
MLPLNVVVDFTRVGDSVSDGAPTVTEVLALSGPLQGPNAGVTEYVQVPAGTSVSEQLVVALGATQVPEAIVCSTTPVQS